MLLDAGIQMSYIITMVSYCSLVFTLATTYFVGISKVKVNDNTGILLFSLSVISIGMTVVGLSMYGALSLSRML